MGVVIGETAEIGDDVHALSGRDPGRHLARAAASATRRSSDGVIVGAGAKVLGAVHRRRRRAHRRQRGGAEGGAGRRHDGRHPGAPGRRAAAARAEAPPAFLPYGTPATTFPTRSRARSAALLDEVAALAGAGRRSSNASARSARAAEPRGAVADEPARRSAKEQVMRLSTKGRYAVMAMVDLAKHGSGEPGRRWPRSPSGRRSRCPISSSSSPSCARRGLVKSVRGPGGGYLLGARRRRDPHLRHHPRGRRADPRHALHARRADRLPRQPEPMSDPRSVGGARQPDPPLSELGDARPMCASSASSARSGVAPARQRPRPPIAAQ